MRRKGRGTWRLSKLARPGEEALLLSGLAVSRLCWAHSKERRWRWTSLTLKEVAGAEVRIEVVREGWQERGRAAALCRKGQAGFGW